MEHRPVECFANSPEGVDQPFMLAGTDVKKGPRFCAALRIPE
jgi:hypothetical protein